MLRDKLNNYRLLLGSMSPRRRELLAGCGLTFEVVKFDVKENYPDGLAAENVAAYLASLKSDGYSDALSDRDILITADTIVVLGTTILGKPADENEAQSMLRRLSGARHRVISGVAICSVEKRVVFTDTTDVWVRELTDEEIAWYVAQYQPLDKAGAYGIQEWLGYAAIPRIEGSYYNVMGLPIEKLYLELEKFI